MNRRLPLLALAPLLVLPSCSAFKLSENGGPSSRVAFGRPTVAEGHGFYVSPADKLVPVQPVVAKTAPAPVIVQPAPVVANPVENVQTAPAPEPVKPADKPAVTKRHSDQDADALRLPGDLLNQLPAEKDYKPSNSSANGDAPVIAKPPGSR